MKSLFGKAVRGAVFAVLASCSIYAQAKESVNWSYKAMTAGRAKLTGTGFIQVENLGAPNFSPEFAMPLQLVYDSEATGLGLFGSVWRCPQLESRLLPKKDGAEWVTPWGEIVRFYNREHMRKAVEKAKDAVVMFPDELRGNGCFAPYSDWIADGKDTEWKVTGKDNLEGWLFEYRKTRLSSVTAPGGRKLVFNYKGDILESVAQNGVKFIEVKAGKSGLADSVSVNGVARTFSFTTVTALLLPKSLGVTAQSSTRFMLAKTQTADLAASVFAYDEQGYLTRIARDRFEDKITVQHETAQERLAWLEKIDALRKAKKNTAKMVSAKISGRILSDYQFKYSYPAKESVKVTNADNAAVTYDYSAQNGVLAITDPNGNTTKIYYFRRFDVAYNGKIRQIRDARDRVAVSYKYDKKTGNLLRATDIAGNETYFSYNKEDQLTLISRSEDELDERPLIRFKRNKLGLPTETALLDRDGKPAAIWKSAYNQHGDLGNITGPELQLAVRTNDFGRPVSVTDTLGRTVTRKYDKFNRLTSATDAFGLTTEYTYNATGLPVEIKRYDTPQKQNLLGSITVTYDDMGQAASVSDDQGRTKKYDRDNLGRVVAEYFPDDSMVKYNYSKAGKLKQVTDPNGHKIGFAWNPLGKMASTLTAAGQQTMFQYDKYGLLTGLDKEFVKGKKASAADQTIAYQYDQYDRLKAIDFGSGQRQALTHDRRGKVTKVEAVDGNTVKRMELEYDQFDRLAAKIVAETKNGKPASLVKYEYAYNAAGKRTALSVNLGKGTRELSWSYDPQGRLVTQKDGSKEITYRYNAKSQLVEQNIGGMPIYYTYTSRGQLESKLLGSKDKPIASLKYEYAKDGSIVARSVNGVRQAYEYDKKGQLLAVKDASGSKVEAYVYDAAGNILQKTVAGKTTRFEYDSANQLAKAYLPDGTVKDYAYDATGRMVKDGNKTLAYGWLNKVMSITEGDKTVASYDYTVEGQVAKSNVNGKTETFVWDDLALIQRDSSELTNEPYMTGGNPIMADGKVLFNDLLGSTMGVAADGSYSPINRTSFGEVDNAASGSYNFFTGKPQVEGLGYAFLLRNYSANTGKWTAQDPLGYPDGWNNLAYGNNAVTNGFDKLGGAWGNSDFVSYYYRSSGSDNIDTDFMGLTGAIWSVIDSLVIPNLSPQITTKVSGLVASASPGYSGYESGSGTTKYDTARGYDFGSIVFSLGGGTVNTISSISYSWYEWTDNFGNIWREFSWSSRTNVSYRDTFVDPIGIGLEVGNAYSYSHSWDITLSGGDRVMVFQYFE